MNIIELTIILEDVEPAVMRILKVPADIRLDRLHLTIQAAMGWHNCHLYEFMAAGARWSLHDFDFGDEVLPANKSTLGEVIEDTGVKSLHYIYDFGDSWEHQIKIGKFSDPVPGELYPRLTEATGTCPPEDIGGLPGYEVFLEAMADPQHPEHDELRQWHGEGFDPNAPQTDELKLEVLKLAKKWKPRKTKK